MGKQSNSYKLRIAKRECNTYRRLHNDLLKDYNKLLVDLRVLKGNVTHLQKGLDKVSKMNQANIDKIMKYKKQMTLDARFKEIFKRKNIELYYEIVKELTPKPELSCNSG